MTATLVYVEHADGMVDEPSLQALTLARAFGGGGSVQAICACVDSTQAPSAALAGHGVETLHVAEDEVFASHAPRAIAEAIVEVAAAAVGDRRPRPGNGARQRGPRTRRRAARPAARRELRRSRGVGRRRGGDARPVGRQPAGARAHPRPDGAPHRAAACGGDRDDDRPGTRDETFTPSISDAARALRVSERVGAATGGISLADAKVVVSGGRGAGSAEGFAGVEELAGLLGGAVGCSRAVTMAGWRPHTDQVGQTGTKISPDLYIACGISGATQHMAGCKGAKRILAINSDREAPILASADYAVIGDLHEIVPAISAAVRAARSS